MTTDFRALCAKVLAYNLGEGDYNFSRLNDYDRDNAAFDAWQEIKAELKSALAEPDGPAVQSREPASVTYHITQQLHRRATVLLIRKVIDQAIRDTASVQWRVADTGEQLVRASDLLAWAEHMEKQMEQLDD